MAASVAALAFGLRAAPASAAAVLERHGHTFTTTSGATVTCDVSVSQAWLEGEATVATELGGPAACRAALVVVGWRYRDGAWARHRGRAAVVGSQRAEATLQGVAGSLVTGHRVELAGCAENCTFGTYVFKYFSAK